MAALSVEQLRAELEAFAVQVLRRELKSFKDAIITELTSSEGSCTHWAGAEADSIINCSPSGKWLSSPVTPRDGEKDNAGAIPPASPIQFSAPKVAEAPCSVPTGYMEFGQVEETSLLEEFTQAEIQPDENANCITKMVTSRTFDNTISVLVLLSLVLIAVQTDLMARHPLGHSPLLFQWIETAFCLIFTVEIILRVCCFGPLNFFCGPHWKWNIFDLTIVSFQCTEAAMNMSKVHRKFTVAPFLRSLRIARVLRLTRFLRLVPDLRMLIVSIAHSLMPLVWVFCLFVFITGAFGVVLTQIVTDHRALRTEEEEGVFERTMMDPESQELLDEKLVIYEDKLEDYFGTLFKSMLSLYMTIADGRHWGELAEPLMECISPHLAWLFIAYTFFVIFAVMNIVTSRFVETAMAAASKDDRQYMVDDLMQTFKAEGHQSVITEGVFNAQFNHPNMQSFLQTLFQKEGGIKVNKDEFDDAKLFRLLDSDKSGSLDTEELITGCVRLAGNASALQIASIWFSLRNMVEEQGREVASVKGILADVQQKVSTRPSSWLSGPNSGR